MLRASGECLAGRIAINREKGGLTHQPCYANDTSNKVDCVFVAHTLRRLDN